MNARQLRRGKLAFGEVAAAMALAGSTVVAGRILDRYLPPFCAVVATLLFALAVLLPLQAFRIAELRSLSGRELALGGLQALFGMVLFRVLLLNGLRLAPASSAGIALSAAPAVTLLLGRLMLRERIGRRRLLSILVTVGGLAVVNLAAIGPGGGSAGRPVESLLGSLLVLGSVASESLMTILRKMSRHHFSALTNATLLCVVSLLLTLPFAAGEVAGGACLELGPPALLAAAYYGAFATVVAYLLWGDGVRYLPAGTAGVAMGAMPISSCLLAAAVLHEPVGPLVASGCLLAVGGIALGAIERERIGEVGRGRQPSR